MTDDHAKQAREAAALQAAKTMAVFSNDSPLPSLIAKLDRLCGDPAQGAIEMLTAQAGILNEIFMFLVSRAGKHYTLYIQCNEPEPRPAPKPYRHEGGGDDLMAGPPMRSMDEMEAAHRRCRNITLSNIEESMRLALKTQNQFRTTVDALLRLRDGTKPS